ncbi:MAG: PQQ-binding-like beta-propeller repeat protein [Planctomycetota bacterium]
MFRLHGRAWVGWLVVVGWAVSSGCPAWGQRRLGEPPPQTVPVYVEDSLEAAEAVEAARALVAEGKKTDAVLKLESARRSAAGRLLGLGPGRYADVGLVIDRLIASDPAMLATYVSTEGPAADRRLGELAPNDLSGMLALMDEAYLTGAGYEAGLAAVGLLLERAEAGEALRLMDRLDEHPLSAAGEQADRRGSLRSAASRLAGEPSALTSTGAWGGLPWGASSESGWGGRSASPEFAAADWSRRLAAGGVRALWRWEREPAGSVAARAGRTVDQSERALAVPALSGDRVLLNVGNAVVGLDRYSGREVWRLPMAEGGEAEANLVARVRMNESRGVWAERGWGAAVLGLGGLVRQGGRGNVAAGSTEVVAFDTADGSVLWRTPIEAMGEPAEGAVLVGTPVVLRDRVVVLMRRSRVAGFQDTIAAGLSQEDGSVAWVRHISSTATSARFTDWPAPSAVERRGLLYVTDRLGAAAAIESATGRVVWLTVLAEASERARRGVDLRSAALRYGPGVVPTSAGLIVSVASDVSGVALLDPVDGRRLAEVWDQVDNEAKQVMRSARALLPIDGDLLAVGASVERIDGERLAIAWRRRDAVRGGLRGEPIVSGGVLVAAGESLVGVDIVTGDTVFDTASSVIGNVVASGSLVVVSGPTAVEGLLDWGQVSERLLARVHGADASQGPDAGLALAFAAWRAGDGEMLLLGVEHALSTAGTSDGGGQDADTVFETILPLAQESSIEPAVRSAIFDRLANVTATASQEVSLRFARGGVLGASGRAAEAIEQYQAVLIDPALRDQLYEGPSLDRLASLEARARIERLMAVDGPDLYAPYEAAAAARLRGLQASGRAEVAALLDLVASYPLSDTSVDALLEAGRLEMGAERWAEAVRVLRRAYARLGASAPAEQTGEVVGRLVASYIADGRSGSAAAWLQRARRERPELMVWTEAGDVALEERLAGLVEGAGSASRPVLAGRQVGSAETIDGRLLGPPPASWNAAQGVDRGVVLMERGGRLVGLSPQSGEVAWATTFQAPGSQVLSRDDDAAVIWWPRGGRVFALDLQTGAELWPSVSVTEELDRVAAPDDQELTDAQRRFIRELGPNAAAVAQLRARIARVGGRLVVRAEEPDPADQLAAGGLETTVIADRDGRVIGIDGLSGEVTWRLRTPLTTVTGVASAHGSVALRGVMFPGEDHQTDAVIVLDATTGQVRLGPLEFHEPVLATALTIDGGLVLIGRDEASLRSVDDGSLRWRTRLADEGTLLGVRVGSESLMMTTRRAADGTVGIVGLNLESGAPLTGPALIASRSPIAPRLLASEDGWLLAGPVRMLGLYPSGELRWADGATLPNDAGVLAAWLGRDRAMVAYSLSNRGGDATDMHRVLTYELATGRIVDDTAVSFPPIEAPALVALTRPDALYLGSGERTVRLRLTDRADDED